MIVERKVDEVAEVSWRSLEFGTCVLKNNHPYIIVREEVGTKQFAGLVDLYTGHFHTPSKENEMVRPVKAKVVIDG